MEAQERLTEPRFTFERLLAKPRTLPNLPVFLDLNGSNFQSVLRIYFDIFQAISQDVATLGDLCQPDYRNGSLNLIMNKKILSKFYTSENESFLSIEFKRYFFCISESFIIDLKYDCAWTRQPRHY